MKKILSYILSAITLLILIISIIFVILNIKGVKDNTPIKIFGYRYSLVVSDSMNPSIQKGDYVIYEEFDEYNLKDVIVYRSKTDNKLIVHEIVEETSFGFKTKGSNNKINDFNYEGYITNDRILGKVVKVTALLGIGRLFTSNKSMVIMIVVIVSFGIIVWQIVDITKALKEKTKEKYQKELEDYKKELNDK
ncbi:signal peptidase I [Haploplasma axanthum]|uniref:Signal peptidase I n=1 Tax=Haploplasma axanthum TaxID=29552 RepID=A0A449BDV8_HAPAX|nr:signal peptidase I [Haploplasma axanthum]VEU80629.1 Signal peptidase I W [Haploplasma axanthum]